MDDNTSVEQPIAQERQKTNGVAIASFTLAILGSLSVVLYILFDFSLSSASSMLEMGVIILLGVGVWLTGLMGLVAIIVGYIAIRRIKKSDPKQKGIGLAIAGIVIGACEIGYGGITCYIAYLYYSV